MFYEKMADEINRILDFDSLDLIEGKVEVNLNDKQASYVWHNVKNREHDYKTFEKILNGAIKHDVYGLVIKYALKYGLTPKVMDCLMNRIDEIPQEIGVGLMATACYQTDWLNKKYNDKFMEIIQGNPANYVTKKIRECEEIDIYKAVCWSESLDNAINCPCWQADYYSALGSVFQSYAYQARDEMFGIASGKIRHDIKSVKFQIIQAKIKTKDIITSIEEFRNDFSKEVVKINDLILSSTPYDVTFIEKEAIADDLVDYVLNTTKLHEKIEMDEDEIPEDYAKDLLEVMIDCCVEKGLPERIDANYVYHRPITSKEGLQELMQTIHWFTTKELMAFSKKIYDDERGAKWISFKSPSLKIKQGSFYRTLFYNWKHRDFVVGVSIKVVENGVAGLEYAVDISQKDSGDFLEPIAIDIDSKAKSYEACLEKAEKADNPEKGEDEIKKKIEKIAATQTVLGEEEKERLKKDFIQGYLDDMGSKFEKELQSSKDKVDFKEAEIEKLKKINEELRATVATLQKQLDETVAVMSQSGETPVLIKGKEEEKFFGETKGFVLSAIQNELRNVKKGNRRYDVLKSVADANLNGEENIIDLKAERIKRITKGYRRAEDLKQDLEAEGFEYGKTGGHPTIRYGNDGRYIMTIAGTTSDVRAGENLAKEIKKKFF